MPCCFKTVPVSCQIEHQTSKSKEEGCNGPVHIKWWRLEEAERHIISSITLPSVTDIGTTWDVLKDHVITAAQEKLGNAKPGRRKIDHQTWLWTEEMKKTVQFKKQLYQKFL
ncbi:uncharacterized protein LOC126336034 [Schistocerca gregaria]|uniref:uncharacterized protein LOC126336034 n=1 Tax=Schistocerca gregaria TaxID=7010 RepID=UPI00211F187F|nr:uncharacterized protein LOC126336034 [Schistocerca gregaria]